MKFTKCLFLTICVFAVVYICSLDFSEVTKFDDRSNGSPPARPKNVDLNVVKKPVQRPAKTDEAAQPDKREVVRRIAKVTPPETIPAQRPQPASAPTAKRVSRTSLEIQIPQSVSEWQARAFLQEHASAIVMLKVEDDQILDALVVDHQEGSQRLSAWEFDEFEEDHDFDHCFWIRLDDRQNALGDVSLRALERFRKSADQFRVYLVFGKKLSGEIQDQLEEQANQDGVSPDELSRVLVALRPIGERLVAEVTDVVPRVVDDNERENAPSPGGGQQG